MGSASRKGLLRKGIFLIVCMEMDILFTVELLAIKTGDVILPSLTAL